MTRLRDKTRSKTWTFTFPSVDMAARAASSFRSLNNNLKFLEPGSSVDVNDKNVQSTWKTEVLGKSVSWYLYEHCRKEFGPGGKYNQWDFRAFGLLQTSAMDYQPVAKRPAVSLSSKKPSSNFTQYDALEASEYYVPGEAARRLKKQGFIVLRQFVPDYLVQPAYDDAVKHFTRVIGAFTDGYAIDQIDEVHSLPGKIWEHKNGVHYNPYSVEQCWGCFTSRGYQQRLGMGQALSANVFRQYPTVMACQHYMKQYLAFLHGCCPEALCWRPEGVSIKGRNQDAAPPHRDQDDHGRYQCVIALAKGAFDVWPQSHTVVLNSLQHDIEGDDLTYLKSKCTNLLYAFEPGDTLIFLGGYLIHGSPKVLPTDPSPRVVTYASFWPPGTSNGAKHAAGKCSCNLPYDRKRKH